MECCSKTDFGMISGRGQYAQSDGGLLPKKLSGNSQDGQHGQHDRHEKSFLRRTGATLPCAGGQDYVSSQANSLKQWSPGGCNLALQTGTQTSEGSRGDRLLGSPVLKSIPMILNTEAMVAEWA